MRIAELSQRSGVTVPTIKYYLREGLLPPGQPTGRNQAAYGEQHLQRLLLIRALRDVGGLSVAAAREVLQVLDEPGHTGHTLMGRAHRAVLRRERPDATGPDWAQARADAAEQVRQLGWYVDPDTPTLDRLADVILAMRRVGCADLLDRIPDYARAALPVAEQEVAGAAAAEDPATMMAAVVTGTVLGEALLSAVRLLAHEHASAQLDGADLGQIDVTQRSNHADSP